MDSLTRLWVKVREASSGQTMAEYALIVAAIVLVIIGGYELTGTTISTLANNVDSSM